MQEIRYVYTLFSRFTGTNAFFIFTRNTPEEGKRTKKIVTQEKKSRCNQTKKVQQKVNIGKR